MEAIIYNTEEEAETMQLKIHSILQLKSKEVRYIANRYSNIIKHPSGKKFACPVDTKKLPNQWAEARKALNFFQKLFSVKTLSSDWYIDIMLPGDVIPSKTLTYSII